MSSAEDRSGETDRAGWSTPDAALAAERSGDITLMPPTLSILLELSELGSLAAIRQAASERVVERVLPQVVQGADGWQFRYPVRGGGQFVTETPYLRLVRAANPGPMTLEGTNTWLVGDPGRGPVVVVDPGPLLAEHLDAIVAAAPGGIATVLLTHRHLDHSEAAAALAERAGCGVRAADPELRVGAAGLADGDRLEVAGASLTVVATPGHTSDSVSACSRARTGWSGCSAGTWCWAGGRR